MKTRIIQTRFWDDEFVSDLDVDSKLVFLYLLTNDSIGMTGIYEKPIGHISFFCGITKQRAEKALEQLAEKILYDGGWVVIKNAIKYNNYASNPKQRMAYMKEWDKIPERLQHYVPYFDDIDEYKPKYKRVKEKNMYKHRAIAEKVLSRKLADNEVVHHIDGDTSNNNSNNLAVMTADRHILLHKGELDLSDTTIRVLSEYSDSTPKSEIRNKKPKIRNQKSKIRNKKEAKIFKKNEMELKEIVDHYNSTFGKNIISTKGFEKNYTKQWREIHDINKIKQAISNARYDKFWQDKLTLPILFRLRNQQGEDVDWIEHFANKTLERPKRKLEII